MSETVRVSSLRSTRARHGTAMSALMIVVGSILLAVSAKVQVPFFPVPMTMQVLVVLLIGVTLGPRLAGATVAAYLLQGAAGLPVFAGTPEKGIGLAYMAGPTGGYLAGFFVAAAAVGWMAERGWDRDPLRLLATGIVGLAAIYALGLLWLGVLIGWDQPVLAYGLWPFLPAEGLKLVVFVMIVHLGNRMLRRS